MVPPQKSPNRAKPLPNPHAATQRLKDLLLFSSRPGGTLPHGPMDKDGFIKLSVLECNNNQLICIGLDCTTG